jgi:4-alpha-glucanotransferase
VDFLNDCGQRFWQLLPLGPTSYGDSPYQSPSVYAGNPYFIDLDLLASDGLLTKKECLDNECSSEQIDYAWLWHTRYKVLRKAFGRFKAEKYGDYDAFCSENAHWIFDYGLFMAIKGENDSRGLEEWSSEHKDYKKQRLDRLGSLEFVKFDDEGLEPEIRFWIFLQYFFFKQWYAIKNYANSKDIKIIGDKPIYTAYDSVEVWSHPQFFQVDENLVPVRVAGCPPDGFSADGQLWGNPLYNWDALALEGYEWLLKTYDITTQMYDMVRIDHFRGFSGYFSILYGETTARNGYWVKGPGKDFLTRLKSRYIGDRIIAEDLGLLDDDVIELLRYSGYPGMMVMQFGMSKESAYYPSDYPENTIAYLGTHDNMTGKQWLDGLTAEEKAVLKEAVVRRTGETWIDACLKHLLTMNSRIVLVMMSDYLGLGKEGRINEPSTLGHNWLWRAKEYDTPSQRKKVTKMTKESGRI